MIDMRKRLINCLLLWLVSLSCACQSYTYDDFNRLISATYSNGSSINYQYDIQDNRTQYVVMGNCILLSSMSNARATGFEIGLSSWVQSTTDGSNWTLYEGATSTNGTGPNGASENKQYLYTESSNGNTNKTFVLESPCFDLNGLAAANFSLDYHMYGNDIGSLSVNISNDGGATYVPLSPNITGNQGNQWATLGLNLDNYLTDQVTVRITGMTGSGEASDIAIDNLGLNGVICPDHVTVTAITQDIYESQSTISTLGNVIINPNENIEFRSCIIYLNPEFEVKQGAVFTVTIDPCSN